MATDPAVLQQRLDEAEAALHKLLTGSHVERVDYDGRMISYSKADMGTLQTYIARLKSDLGQSVKPRRALGILA